MNRDIVVVGASAGGVELLLDMVPELPADLPASLFIVVHMPPGYASALPELLTKRGRLPARHPVHDESIERGTIYVAPSDNHMQLRHGAIEVVRGPKDNGHRPAADVLFRTASAAYGSRVVGVVLSGYQDCGTAGLLSVKARGGIAVVQDPATAAAPEMPQSALQKVSVDHIVHPIELPGLITKLVNTQPGPTQEPAESIAQLEGTVLGKPADIVCPICEGVLTEAQPGVFHHFRCHVGHAFSLDSLLHEQGEEMERVLWAAVRALEESATLARRISTTTSGELGHRFAEKAATHAQNAEYIRNMLLHGSASITPVEDQPHPEWRKRSAVRR
jgi:two-component system, chemotaxis family, protein-glutamate methylesterase/glutaminase